MATLKWASVLVLLSVVSTGYRVQAQTPNTTCDSNLVDLAFVVDASGSVKHDSWRRSLDFVRKVVSAFEVGPKKARISFVSFSTNATVNFYLNDYQTQDAVLRHINENELKWMDGWTNTRQALEFVRTKVFTQVNGERPDAPNLAIVITDGASNVNPHLTVPEALKVHNAGITVLAVGISSNISIPELMGIASDPDEDNMFTLDSYVDLIKREQEISTRACQTIPDCTGQADIVLALDASGSIGEANWKKLQTFVKSLITGFNIGTGAIRMAVMSFGNKAIHQFGFNDHKTQISAINAIDSIQWLDQETNTSGALWYMRELFKRSNNVQKIGVIITDGASNRDADRTIPEATLTKASGVELFAIGIGDELNQAELEAIASDEKDKHVYNADDYDALQKLKAQVVKETCDVVPGCEMRADIFFLLDASGSIKEENWQKVLQFAKNVVNKLPIENGDVRVGFILFGDTAERKFTLNQYTKKADITAEIDRFQWLNQNTNTSGAIRLMRWNFVTRLGDRPGVTNVGIVLTDGESTFDKDLTIPEANLAKKEGIRMFAIGVGDQVNRAELEGIANSPSSSYVFEVDTFDALTKIQKELVETSCEEDPSGACREETDVVFMIDGSGSMGRDFTTLLKFVSNFLEDLDIDKGTTRVGALVFSDRADIVFNLNRYTKTQEMRAAIENIKYPRGRSNIRDGIRRVTEEMFRPQNGDRRDAKNIIFLFTDGNSNDPRATLQEASKAKAKGIHIIAAAIGQWLNMAEIRGIVSTPSSKNAFQVSKAQEVNNLRSQFRSYICNSIVDCNPCENSATCVDLINDYECLCQPPFVGKHCNATCREDADVVFLVDSSGSIGQANYEKVLDYIKDVLNNVNVEQSTGRALRVGLATYADNVVLRLHLNHQFNTRRSLVNAINFDYTGGTTNTAEALKYMRETMFTSRNGDRSGKKNVAVLITDGRSNNQAATIREAQLAKKAGITILTVAIGNSVDEAELNAMTTDPDKYNLYRFKDFSKLYEGVRWLAASLCNNDNECESNPCQNSATCKDKINAHQCGPCPNGYTGIFCERGCDGRIDLALVIDSSGSIHHERFREKVKPFIISIIEELDVSPTTTRIGAVTWSDDSQLRFNLNTYSTKEDVKQGILALPFLGKRTNTASALRRMTDQLFSGRDGDRSNIPNFAIVLTDGNSNVDQENTLPEAIRAKLKGIHIIVISIGRKNSINLLEINGIASNPDSANVFFVDRYNALAGLKDQLVKSVCNDVNECASNPCRSGGTCVDGLKQYQCICPEGRTGLRCERACSKQVDVVFVIDTSGSVQRRFQLQMQFARQVVNGLDFTFGRTRVGVVLYHNNAKVDFVLDKYNSKADVLNAMTYVSNGGRTHTADGIYKMRRDVFTQGGDRNGIQNVCLVITDGHSNINPSNTQREAQSARQSNIQMFAVGVGDNFNQNEINDIASDPDSNFAYTNIRNEQDVERNANKLLDQICA